jgi:hypothetical protein
MTTPNQSLSSTIMKRYSRRHFLHCSAVAGGVALLPGCASVTRVRAPGEKLNIATIGAAGKGSSDTDHCATENIVALCDADESMAASQLKKYPKAKFYRDFRKMFDAMADSIDAVIVSTPDHVHAPAAIMAMKLGKHVYCQKPLVHSVYEARLMRNLAKQKNLVTQMGNQGSAEDGLRRAVEVIQSGIISPVRQVHVWSNRPIWPQGLDRPAGEDPIPPSLDWDVWLGPAPARPFKKGVYHPFNWRGWQDFGTGALGDMACHTANMPFRALKLGYPTEVEAESPPINKETYPLKSRIRFEFPAREGLAPVTFWWYDGGNPKPDKPTEHDGNNKPPRDLTAEIQELLGSMPGSGCLLVGDKGKIFSPDDYGAQFYLMLSGEKGYKNGRDHEAVKGIPQSIPRNAFRGDGDWRHHQEWLAGIKGGPVPYSNFDIAAYLTEIILLGCVALRVGKRLEWDGPRMQARNAPEAQQYVRRQYRKGWTL